MRRILSLLILACVVLACGRTATAESQRPRRPNFLFIYTDDQRWDALGVVQREQGDKARFPWFKTPHLDRLAEEGIRFRNAFVVSSLCAPSRAAFLTGRYNHVNGIANNHSPFGTTTTTYASLLREAGYKAGYVGKWHMGSQSGKRPGFDYSASFVGQGRYNDCPFEVDGVLTKTEGWVDDRSVDYAVDFMNKHRDVPFALVVGLKSTHGPWDPPDRAADRFREAVARPTPNLAVPAIYQAEMRRLQTQALTKAQFKAQAKTKAATKKAAQNLRNPANPAENARAGVNLNYFRCLSASDDNVGRLLEELDKLKIAEDTVVVFTSDNGYYLGEHGLGDKRTAYDESLRIPFLVRYPRLKQRGAVVDSLVLNIDVAPTFLDLAGVPIPKEIQGRSLKEMLVAGKPAADWRTSFFYEYFRERGFNPPATLAVRTENAKLIKYPGHDDWTEVFDLKTDPYETRNLAKDPAGAELRKLLEAEYDRQARAVEFRVPDYADQPQTP